MTVKEAADYLTERGYRCGGGTVRALARSGRLRCYRPGATGRGRYEFTPRQLDDFLAAAESGPAEVAPSPAPAPATPPPPRPRPARPAPSSDWRERLRQELAS